MMTTLEIPKPTEVNRSLSVTYCDDVRVELHNKTSLIGIYRQNLIFPDFPARILRLCIVVEPSAPGVKPYRSVSIAVYRDDVQIGYMQLSPPDEAWSRIPPEGGNLSAVVPFVFENLEFSAPAKFRVRAIFDDGVVIPGPSLVVEKGEPPLPA